MRSRRRRKKRQGKEGASQRTRFIIREVISFLLLGTAAIMLGILCTLSFGMKEEMTGNAMFPSIADGDRVLINRVAYQFSTPERDDIIVFHGGGSRARTYIRRVVAVSGDTVRIQDGILYVNGEAKDDEFYDRMQDAGIAARDIVLSGAEAVVLGDNRNESEDSRSENIGVVNRADIAGRVWRIY